MSAVSNALDRVLVLEMVRVTEAAAIAAANPAAPPPMTKTLPIICVSSASFLYAALPDDIGYPCHRRR